MNKIKFYCVTNKQINFINKEEYNFGWVGKEILKKTISNVIMVTIYFIKKILFRTYLSLLVLEKFNEDRK